MKVVKLTKKAQDIVNQIMSADAVDVDHGPVGERIAYGNSFLSSEGLEFNVNVDGEIGEIVITNETLNEATVVNGVIQIDANHINVNGVIQIDADHIKDNPYGDMTITLYKLSKINAV